MQRLFRWPVLVFAALFYGLLMAADNNAPQDNAGSGAQEQSSAAVIPTAGAGQPGAQEPPADGADGQAAGEDQTGEQTPEQTETEEEESEFERFVPSEQISQDLGVSFPVDI